MKRIFILLTLLATCSYADICDPPLVTLKTNDFRGQGVEVAIIWNTTNDCPNTRYFREYTLDNGVTWQFPTLLGTATGAIDPDTGEFIRYRKFFFYLPVNTPFITRAVPYDDFVPPGMLDSEFAIEWNTEQITLVKPMELPAVKKKHKKAKH